MRERLEQLDSLRGLAALSVVFHHFLIMFPAFSDQNNGYEILKYSPVHIFWTGREAVILFFVLSGFVLSLPFFSSNRVNYPAFYVKRICRIYIPYIAAVLIAILLSRVFYGGGIPELSKWFNRIWIAPLNIQSIISHILLIGRVNNDAFNPVIWSLVHEMRISLIFPIIILIVNRLSWKQSLLAGGLITCIGYITNYLISHYMANWNDLGFTLQYTFMFIIGTLLAKHRQIITGIFSQIGKNYKFMILLAGIGLYTYPWWFLHKSKYLHLSIIDNFVISLGVLIFIIFALSSKSAMKILTHRYLVFMGKVSYSIYLYHAIILISLTYILFYRIPIWGIYALTLILTMLVSAISYKYVEIPSINAGRSLAKLMVKYEKTDKLPEIVLNENT